MMQTAGRLAGRGGSPRKQQGQHVPPAQTQAGRGGQRRPAQAAAVAEKDKPLVFKVCWVCTSSRRPPTNTATPPRQARTGVSTLLPWPARLAAKLAAQGKIGTLSDAHASRPLFTCRPHTLTVPSMELEATRELSAETERSVISASCPRQLACSSPVCVDQICGGGREGTAVGKSRNGCKGSHDKERRLKLSSGLGKRQRESRR